MSTTGQRSWHIRQEHRRVAISRPTPSRRQLRGSTRMHRHRRFPRKDAGLECVGKASSKPAARMRPRCGDNTATVLRGDIHLSWCRRRRRQALVARISRSARLWRVYATLNLPIRGSSPAAQASPRVRESSSKRVGEEMNRRIAWRGLTPDGSGAVFRIAILRRYSLLTPGDSARTQAAKLQPLLNAGCALVAVTSRCHSQDVVGASRSGRSFHRPRE